MEEDTWKSKENLKNAMEIVKEFEKEYSREEEEEEVRQQEAEGNRKTFSRELPGRYMTKLLYRWDNKRYDREYWKQMEENWRWWKKNPFSRYNKNLFLKKIKEEEEYKGGKIEEWNEEEDEKDWRRVEEDRKYLKGLENENQDMGDLRDPYNKL